MAAVKTIAVDETVLDASIRVIKAARAVAASAPAQLRNHTARVRSTRLVELREALEAWDKI